MGIPKFDIPKINCSLPCDESVQGDLRNLGIPCRSIADN